MRCPYCGHNDSKVADSREVDGAVRRRRQCLGCGQRFTTFERVQASGLLIVKKDGRREPYQREKLEVGIRKACEKRPLPIGAIERVVDDIEAELHRLGRAEVPSQVVGDLVMERLKGLDHIAYIRFASVYREFRDLEDVRREVEDLVTPAPKAQAARERRRRSRDGQLPLIPNEEQTLIGHREHSKRSAKHRLR